MDEYERWKRAERRDRIAWAILTWVILAFAFIGFVSVLSSIVYLLGTVL
jgi:hypothetical protein